jgi:RNA polymerase sigma-70 factor (sigma-E family)
MGLEMATEPVPGSRLGGLYSAHIDYAVRLAFLMTGDRLQAQDIAHDAFVKIAGRFRDLRDPAAFPAYLRTTVLNLSRSHLRRLRTQRDYLQRERAAAVRPRAVTQGPEPDDALWQSLQKLTHRQRAAIVLRYYEDLSEAQTAEALGCSLSAVKSLVSRGLQDLREQIGGAR